MSKGAKETIVSKLGFRSNTSAPKAEAELERVRKENAHLRRKIDDLAKRHLRPPDSDKSKLLERILSLETLRERNNQQLMAKEQEMENMRQQLSAKGGEVVATLQTQLEHRRREAEQRDGLFQSLTQETENLKNKLATVSARCQTLETQVASASQAPPADMAVLQDQLRDALEKNQNWLIYDQQREAFVQSVLGHTRELEAQLAQAQQPRQELNSEAPSTSAAPEKSSDEMKSHYEQLLSRVQKDLQDQKDQTLQTQQELLTQREKTSEARAELQAQEEATSALRRSYDDRCRELTSIQRKYEDASKELEETKDKLQAERNGNRYVVDVERMVSTERSDRMRLELDNMEVRLEEERKRSADLLLQVNLLQKSLLSQNEEKRRIEALEQQLSAKDDDKLARENMQHQLHKVLKELRKARDQIAKLEANKHSRFSEPSSYDRLEFERLNLEDSPGLTSPSRITSLMDESFLECPNCHISYPTSRHRELLAHIDICFA